ncbi:MULTISPECIES: hypothetical protein [unclassified Breznakia]|uniref:hypothetical protein n=1 Tax=unclassified Breznakia TaxID=2623764 RepID=UPI0024732685|nr:MULTISPECIES: hypothetical protein [unclassified Breznakia]MDH6367068.1 hypothetical protein [Breznakia sp. PH1-1]MDH6404160.1 hypothetical protein [Breznakia sp. PF1-11]MDH6411955.1 hypothetical protein [Breznakia sp. PFB1-11]MDH6414148.1 hypothetical protein [Breznakia sp. PFB1-14]MDH6418901.1 hypothetical protein [Breznakia sp. PFB1-12]
MHLLTHILSRMATDGAAELLTTGNIEYFLLPDAIRFYSKDRKYSHFENDQYTDLHRFGMIYPNDLKKLTSDEVVTNCLDVTGGTEQVTCSIGETTNIDLFEMLNRFSIDEAKYNEIKLHLQEDMMFDTLLREELDCSKKFEDVFYSKNGKQMNGVELRDFVRDMDLYISAKYISQIQKEQNLDVKEWVQKDLFEYLRNLYPMDMLANSYKFLSNEIYWDKLLRISDNIHELDTIESEFTYFEMLDMGSLDSFINDLSIMLEDTNEKDCYETSDTSNENEEDLTL